MEYLRKKVLSQYPDIEQVTEIYHEMMSTQSTGDDGDTGDSDDIIGDDKYRPLLLLLAVLYKVQERNDDFFKHGGTSKEFYQTRESLELAGFFWHQQHHMGKILRESINTAKTREEVERLVEKNRVKMMETLELEDVHVSVSELHDEDDQDKRLNHHTPDFVIHTDHQHRAVVFTILGTRIFPRPCPRDIIMDCAAKCQPFLDGEAHGGMVTGHQNLIKTALPIIHHRLQQHPECSLLVVGYSLGAALAQLFMLDLEHGPLRSQLPENTTARAILFGCPPVYSGSLETLDNVLMISNHNDGVTGASLKCLHDVMFKTKAIHKLNIQRRTLLKMALNINNTELSEGGLENILSEDVKSPTKSSSSSIMKKTKKTVSKMLNGATQDVWDKVMETSEHCSKSCHPQLSHVSNCLVVIKKPKNKGELLRISQFSGSDNISQFSRQIRFKYGMMDHHMPWSYNSIFTGTVLKHLLQRY